MLESIKQFLALNPQQITLGLERIKSALLLCDNPQLKYKVIHIAGTNGKGSTAAFIECGIIHSGYKVGKFTSPHIHKINETIRLNGQQINDHDLEQQYEILQQLLAQNNLQLSFFEMLCLIMFNYFAIQGIDYLVLECGMGGADDATNVVDSVLNIITNIGLEHTQWLGSDLASIATAKAGIIHNNSYTILGSNTPELIAAVKIRTDNYFCINEYNYTVTQDNLKNTLTMSDNSDVYQLHLAGKFQIANFLCAYTALKHLKINDLSIKYAAENTQWAGRLQILEHDPLVIVDAMHNAHGTQALVDSLMGYYSPNKVVIICSILQDKDINTIFEKLSNISTNLILTNITNTPRAAPVEKLYEIAHKYHYRFNYIQIIDKPNDALEVAKAQSPQMIVICGSTYLLNYFIEDDNA